MNATNAEGVIFQLIFKSGTKVNASTLNCPRYLQKVGLYILIP